MTDTQHPQPMSGTTIREYVRAVPRHRLADEQARQERIHALEQERHRIVGGGQTGLSDGGRATWEITD
ncbi:hypothetical protein [Streptomyces atratus]|uniref:Uncharacterized protein n=1 Tax=Streptomyces atratus TaxID=1893 RepID=A0A2Z5J6I2_STRAR|nr:hypothetical protein [Streptomyces atratus]AXE75936.1 hypothetical protein C5746_01865 [Streptomyces atratus]